MTSIPNFLSEKLFALYFRFYQILDTDKKKRNQGKPFLGFPFHSQALMGRRQTESEVGRFTLLILFLMGTISFCMVYFCLSVVFKPSSSISKTSISDVGGYGGGVLGTEEKEEEEEVCCRGIDHLELWGAAVKWGSDFKVNSSKECCMACKAMCGGDGSCSCDSWVFCGNPEACGPRFGEVWFLAVYLLQISSS